MISNYQQSLFETKPKLTPFIKWAGGKTQLLGDIIYRLPKTYNRYFEPFIGGGALFFSVQPASSVINDINPQLINVYNQLKMHVEAIICAVNELDRPICHKERYFAIREQYNSKIRDQILDVECAALMIWLNKHCFNGLYRVNAKGEFNVPFNNKTHGSSIDADNLRAISEYLNKNDIELRNGDFEDACRDVQAGDFVYFDSPYVPMSNTANFTTYAKDGFNVDAHRRLAELFKQLDGIGAYMLLSNNDAPLVRELYDGYQIESVDVRRAINKDTTRRTGKEVLISNFQLPTS